MQVVGRICAECDAKIRTETDGRVCIDCDVAFHADCLGEDDEHCPRCQASFAERIAQRRAQAETQIEESVARGRNIVLTIVLGWFGLSVLTLVMNASLGSTDVTATGAARVALTALLLFFLYMGHRWAFVLSNVLLGFGVLLGLVFGSTTLGDSVGGAVMLFTMTGLALVALLYLVRSDDVHAFLARQRRAPR